MQNQGSLDILAEIASEYGFAITKPPISEACRQICKKRMRSFVKQCVEIAMLDADQKKQEQIVQTEQMPLVRKRMRICSWTEK